MDQKKVRFTFIDERVMEFTTTTFMCTADRIALERQYKISVSQAANPSEEWVLFFLFRAGQRVSEELKVLTFEDLVENLETWELVGDEDVQSPPLEEEAPTG